MKPHIVILMAAAGLAWLAGCGSPNTANIELRKQNQELTEKVDELKRAREGDLATIKSLQGKVGTIATLPQDRLEKLYTVHGLTLGRLTGGADLDRSKAGDEGLKIQATPIDQDGQQLKAAGSFVVEAFDLAANPPAIGKWTFDTAASKQNWLGALMTYNYVLTFPWQMPPKHEEITVKVTFRDELTGREFSAQKVVKVQLP